jgi:hypothetical protein
MTTTTSRLTTLTTLLLLAFVASGCGIGGGTSATKYERGDTGDNIVEAFADGQAKLYSGTDLTPEASTPIEKGENIGFRDDRTATGGNVIAVAGDFERAIEQGTVFDRTYYWKIEETEE